MSQKHFIKVVENFICQNCGEKVKGGGYTNHCPKCLYSLHVDEKVPGDRKSKCRGLMEPIGIDKKGDTFIIVHKCVNCGKIKKNKAVETDRIEILFGINT